MKTQPQTSPERACLAGLIGEMNVAMLTTPSANGSLQSRPMAPLELDAHGALWFFIDLRSPRLGHLRVLNLSFSDAASSTYVSLSGQGELIQDREHIDALWTTAARPWFPDGPKSTNLGLLKIIPDEVEYWDAPDSRMVRMFALAASVLAGTPIAMGEHVSLHELSSDGPTAAAVA